MVKLRDEHAIQPDVLCYVDDVLAFVEVEHLSLFWSVLEVELRRAGLSLKKEKSKAWLPSADTPNPRINAVVQQVFGGIPILGNTLLNMYGLY